MRYLSYATHIKIEDLAGVIPSFSLFISNLKGQHNNLRFIDRTNKPAPDTMEINIGDILGVEVTKATEKQPAGLKIKEDRGKFYVEKISGLFKNRNTPLKVGDQILELNGKDVGDYKGLSEMKRVVKDEIKIWLRVMRLDPDRSESSGSESPVEEEPEEEIPDYEYEEIVCPAEKEPEDTIPDYVEIMHYEDPIKSGDIMRLQGLQAKPELNGRLVKVLEEGTTKGRWQVELIDTKATVSVSAEKLVPAPEGDQELLQLEPENPMTLRRLKAKPKLNGKSVQVLPALEGDKEPVHGEAVVSYTNIEPGDVMKLRRLKAKPKLNGKLVKVLQEDATQGRWQVEVIESKIILSIAADKLVHMSN